MWTKNNSILKLKDIFRYYVYTQCFIYSKKTILWFRLQLNRYVVIILTYKYEMWTHLPLKCSLRMIKAVMKHPRNDILPVLSSKYSRFFKNPIDLRICFYDQLSLWLKVVRQMHEITTSWTSLPIHLRKLPHPRIKNTNEHVSYA